MKLGSTRSLAEMRHVLLSPDITDPETVYWVFSELGHQDWANLTIITPHKLGQEYPKTFGHYHSTEVEETYHLIEGEGILLMQKKHFEDDHWVENMVDEVYLIKAHPGDEIIITPEWGHSWSNIGDTPLLSFDNWTHGHHPSDYQVIENLNGMAYYLTEKDGQLVPMPNPKYKNLPEAHLVTASEFSHRGVIYPT